MTDRVSQEHVTLHRIAQTLGTPIRSFFEDEQKGQLHGVIECLKLCQEIKSEEGMRQALAALRRIAREEKQEPAALWAVLRR